MIGFCLGIAVGAAIAWFLVRRLRNDHKEVLKAIYHGYGAPDEYGHVGWYRDNRNGSPFKEPGNPWSEIG